MKALQRLGVALLVFVIAGNSEGAEKDQLTVSKWSEPISNLQIRVSCPRRFEIGNPRSDLIELFVKCEIKNAGSRDAVIRPLARVYLVNDAGRVEQCRRYTRDGIREIASLVLKPGATASWWQNGTATPRQRGSAIDKDSANGTYQVYVGWAANEELKSPSASLVIAGLAAQEFEQTRLPEHANEFPKVVPNTVPNKVSFQTITFTNDPIIVNGYPHRAISFDMPAQAGALVWGIVRDPGLMVGWFSTVPVPPERYEQPIVQKDVPGIAKKGDTMLFHRFHPSEAKTKNRYTLWFANEKADVPSITVSINVLADTDKPFSDIFSEFYKAGINE